jgi:hypothetical protein
MGQNLRAGCPKFGDFEKVFDQLIEVLGRRRGAFQTPSLSRTSSPAKMHLPARRGRQVDSWCKLAKALAPAGQNL